VSLNRCEEWGFDDPTYHSAFMFSIIGLPVRVEFGIVVSLSIALRNYIFEGLPRLLLKTLHYRDVVRPFDSAHGPEAIEE